MGLHTEARKKVGRGAKNHFVKFSSRRWRHHPEPRSPELPDRPVVQQRNAANARERARMQVLSGAFHRLKACLPWVPRDTKLSKLDTLRLAASYIAHLIRVLQEEVDQPHADTGIGAPHPVALTWPFMINSRSDCTSQDPCRLTAADDSRTLVPCEYQTFHYDAVHFVQQ